MSKQDKQERIIEIYHYNAEHGDRQKSGGEPKIKRVAAYCRVSTLHEEQELSFQTQKEYYEKLIRLDPTMRLVGVYGDMGLSGLSVLKRPSFQQMLEDCKKGRIDVVITKSVSRFSRNVQDCIETLETLKKLGVTVVFERENIVSTDPNSELFLHILSLMAQEESNSLSQAMRWAKTRRAEVGNPMRGVCYGYKKDGEGHWLIEKKQAKRVRLAFSLADRGVCYKEILARLNHMEEADDEKPNWYQQKLTRMLRNEAYRGDILTGKHYVEDYRSKKERRNEGERSQYYIEGHHEAIISAEQFARVGDMIDRRALCTRRGKAVG